MTPELGGQIDPNAAGGVNDALIKTRYDRPIITTAPPDLMTAEARLDAIAEDRQYMGRGTARKRTKDRPVTGTRLIREWKGGEHVVTATGPGAWVQRGDMRAPYPLHNRLCRSAK